MSNSQPSRLRKKIENLFSPTGEVRLDGEFEMINELLVGFRELQNTSASLRDFIAILSLLINIILLGQSREYVSNL